MLVAFLFITEPDTVKIISSCHSLYREIISPPECVNTSEFLIGSYKASLTWFTLLSGSQYEKA